MVPVQLVFESNLKAPPAEVWAWAISLRGISAELAPVMRMTAPEGISSLSDAVVEPGKPLLRSWILLFGLLPIDRSDLTLVELEPGRRFLERSPMLSMKLWQHERVIEPRPDGGSQITDRLTFEPRLAAPLVKWFIATVFTRRHRILRETMGDAG